MAPVNGETVSKSMRFTSHMGLTGRKKVNVIGGFSEKQSLNLPQLMEWCCFVVMCAIISEFSSYSQDEFDIFTDPRIKRLPVLNNNDYITLICFDISDLTIGGVVL
jgi:hypothetical protein